MWVQRSALLVVALVACGCSSESSDGGASSGGAPIPGVFAEYCAGTLTTSVKLMRPEPPFAWMGNGSAAAAGTPILMADRFDAWEGFSFGADGSPLKTSGDLVKGTHFTSDCVPDDKPSFTAFVHVLLADSTFHANQDLSGTSCTLPAGTRFESFQFAASGKVASVSADAILAQCQLDTSYSKDILYGELLPK